MRLINNRKVKFLIAFIALFVCITQIQQTFAKYVESKEGDANFTVAKWKILVNQQDITETATISSLINPVYLENENIKDGVIAPSSEGYFDLEIDASNVDVSFQYIISIANSENSSVSDLKITGYSLNESAIILVDDLNNITDTIRYTDPNKVNNKMYPLSRTNFKF